MKNKILVLSLMLLAGLSFAQQDAQFTQYMYNTNSVNPAYAGTKAGTSLFLLNRAQWVGLDGAPVTTNASIHAPLNKSNVGLGLSIINDKIGPSDESSVAIDFSYTILMSENYKLSFGLKASGNLLNIDFNKLNIYHQGDFSFETNINNKFSPNVGVGFYLFSDKSYIGLSAPNLFKTKHFDKYANVGANSIIAQERVNYYLIAGHVFDLNSNVKFKPALLTKAVQGAPLQIDVSGNFLFNEKFTAGLAYRWDIAVSAMVGFQVSDSFFIGYGYDMETTRLASYNSGTHEIFLKYDFFNRFGKIVSPRFF
ncbi:type IX secretion system membrane protein, PorP/SprF family [Lutibacter oricola]|uniref:Type IX secretion system membrane protein, PorP/SprF family n=1 Tax=Lutibacter oricola TaxID=762486 RepID=A0A1H3GNS2_9FLAO|nr:type IX secretion system membrane protein PorP/SprF [Lutibacter oricola]SDY04268.1 type IX secretion system membrane protein, PorP/SprF family [Lutibacter oricola]